MLWSCSKSRITIKKNYLKDKTSLPDESKILVHAVEVLRQVEGSRLEKNGWVGGDTWFGSILSCAELKNLMDVNCAFVEKNNTTFFSMKPFYRLLKAKDGDRPASRWVEITAIMSDIDTIVIACAWSQRGVSYFLRTCESEEIHEDKHIANFEDCFGNVACHNLHEVLPLIEDDNRMRQTILRLEKK